MNACRFLLTAIFVSTTVLMPVTDSIVNGQETPAQKSLGNTSNPFVTPDTAKPEAQATNSTQTTPAVPVVEAEIVTPEFETPEIIAAPVVEEVAINRVQAAPTPVFFDAPASSYSDRKISEQKVAELRQARALYRANQRMARMEYNLWIGHQPLRPRRSPMQMMNSRYSPPTIIVPIFVNPR